MNELKILTLNIKSFLKNYRHVIVLIKKYNPDFLFLQETYIDLDTEYKAQTLNKKWDCRRAISAKGFRQRGSSIQLLGHLGNNKHKQRHTRKNNHCHIPK